LPGLMPPPLDAAAALPDMSAVNAFGLADEEAAALPFGAKNAKGRDGAAPESEPLAFLAAGTAAAADPADPSRKACASGLVTKPLNTAPWKPLTRASHSGHEVKMAGPPLPHLTA